MPMQISLARLRASIGRPAVDIAGRSELVRGDDRGRVAGERSRIGGKVCRIEAANPHSAAHSANPEQEADAALREGRGESNDRDRADEGADQPERCLAQRRPEARLGDDRRRRRGPVRFVELEPERDVEREAHRGPDAQSIEQRLTGGLCVREQPGSRSLARLEKCCACATAQYVVQLIGPLAWSRCPQDRRAPREFNGKR